MDEGAMRSQRPPDASEVPPPAGAQMERDEPFPARVAAQDRRSFAEEIFDQHAQEIHRYVLAWTADTAVAGELTVQVLRTAVKRMERLSEPGTDIEARLVALARAAVARRAEARSQSPGPLVRNAGAFTPSEPVPLLLDTVARLDDGRRDVVVLRQLLGHSVDHAARLLAFDAPVVAELERAAYATLWRRLNHAQDTQPVSAWDALTVAAALRQGAQSWLAPPDEAVLTGLREQLLDEVDPDRGGAAAAASEEAGGRRRLLAAMLAAAGRHRWLLAGCMASAVIGMVAALTIGQAGQSSSCSGSGTCLVPTTESVADSGPSAGPSPPGQSILLPTSTTRAAAGSDFPAMTSASTQTTGLAPSTTTMPSVSTPPTTRPRSTTTITTTGPTTSSTLAPTTTGDNTTTTGAGSVTVRDQTVSFRRA